MPVLDERRQTVRIIAGTLFGASSPVRTSSPMFYADVALPVGAAVPLDADHEERAIYTVSGAIEIAGDVFGPAISWCSGPATASPSGPAPTPAS